MTEQLYTILEQNAPSPITPDEMREFNVSRKTWTDKLKFIVRNITSVEVDAQAQRVSCNAQLQVTAKGADTGFKASVNYSVTPDLASSNKVIVTADTSDGSQAVAKELAEIAKPDIEKPLQAKADAEKARSDRVNAALAKQQDDLAAAYKQHEAEREAATPPPTKVARSFPPQVPCKEDGHTAEKSCIVVQKYLTGFKPTEQDEFQMMLARAVDNFGKDFSLIFDYQIQPGGANSDVGMMMTHDTDSAMATVHSDHATRFWITTHDSGRTWSAIKSVELKSGLRS